MAGCESSVHTQRQGTFEILSSLQCKSWDWVVLVIYTASVFFAIWGKEKYLARGLLIATIIIVGVYLLPNVRSILGLDRRKDPWYREWFLPIGATLVMASLLLIFALGVGIWEPQTHVAFFDKSMSELVVKKLPTIIFQQCLLQWHFIPLLLRVLRNRQHAFVLGAAIFSAFHLPNPLLMLLTFIAGWVWVYSYHANQRMVPLVLSHLTLAMIAANCCGEYVFNMRVGWGCVSLFPKPVPSTTPRRFELPGCAVGEIELVSTDPSNGRTCLHGWYVDAHYHSAPSEVFAQADGRFIPLRFATLIEGTPEPIKELDPLIRTKYEFAIDIPDTVLDPHSSWTLWMANKHGWLYQFPPFNGYTSTACYHLSSDQSKLVEHDTSRQNSRKHH